MTLVFSKAEGWKISQNSNESTCAEVSLLTKLLAGCKTSTSNCWCTCVFLMCHLFIPGEPGDWLHSANIISNVRSCGDGLQKKHQN